MPVQQENVQMQKYKIKPFSSAKLKLGPELTFRSRHICNGNASDFRVTKAKQERPIGPLFEDQV